MVAATETAPIERIPLQKDEGAENAQKSERAHSRPTASQPARQHHRCTACTAAHRRAAAQKARGPQKAAAPDSLFFAAEATFAALTPVFAHRARCRIDAPRNPG